MARIILVGGGSRSGKSAVAEERVAKYPRVAYLATMRAFDEEMRSRIAIHQSRRPASWTTIECQSNLAAGIASIPADTEAIMIDCLTVYLSNLLLANCPDAEKPPHGKQLEPFLADIDKVLEALRNSPAKEAVLVTNEVGCSVVQPSPLGRAFADLQGWANQRVAKQADEVYFVAFGIAQKLK